MPLFACLILVFISELTQSRFQGQLQHTNLYDSSLQYELTVEEKILSCSTSKQQVLSTTLAASSTDFSYSGVKPYAQYCVTVRPRRSDGLRIGGTDSVKFETPASIPQSGPKDLQVKAVNSRSATLQWSPLSCEYWNGQTISYWIEILITNKLVGNKNLTGTEATFTKLLPYTSYDVKIYSVNNKGFSTAETIDILTSAEAPSQAPSDIKLKKIHSTNFTVSWTATPVDLWNGPNRHYLVVLKKENTALESVNIISAEITVTNLSPYTNYTITISSGNSVGYSPGVDYSTATAADIPSKPPNDLTASAVTARSAVLTWTAPPVNTWNGPNPHYRVHVQKGGESIQRINISLTTAVVSKLRPYTNYTIMVSSGNSVGYSTASESLTLQTIPDIPDQPPTNIQGVNIASRSVQFSWTAPPAHSWNGPNTYYFILVTKQGVVVKTINESTTSATVSNLTPYSAYLILVHSGNSAGISADASRWIFNTSIDFPSQPTALKVSTFFNGSVTLSWEEPQEKNGVLESYQINCSWNGTSISFTSRNTTATVFGVTVGSSVTCHVAASTRRGFGAAAVIRHVVSYSSGVGSVSDSEVQRLSAGHIAGHVVLAVAVLSLLAVVLVLLRRRKNGLQSTAKNPKKTPKFQSAAQAVSAEANNYDVVENMQSREENCHYEAVTEASYENSAMQLTPSSEYCDLRPRTTEAADYSALQR